MADGWAALIDQTSPPSENGAAAASSTDGRSASGGVCTYTREEEEGVPASELDLTIGAQDKFPIDVFSPTLRSIAEQMGKVYQTPVSLPAMSVLAGLSGAIGKSVVVRGAYKDKATPLNLYVFVIGEPGSGKGNVGDTLIKPIAKRSRDLAEKFKTGVAEDRAELGTLKKRIVNFEQHCAKNGFDGEPAATLRVTQKRVEELETKARRKVTMWVADSTSEALGRALNDNDETLFSFSSEAGAAVKVAFGKYSKDGKGDYELLLSAYSGDAVKTDRISRTGVELLSPCLALLWMVQPAVIRQVLEDEEARSRGLTARPLIFDSQAQREFDDRSELEFTNAGLWKALVDMVIDCRLGRGAPLEIRCTPDAREAFSKFEDETIRLERGPCADLRGELSRWRQNAIKVAGIFAVAEQATEISALLAERAVKVVRWCGYNYLGLLQGGRRQRMQSQYDRLVQLLSTNGGSMNLGPLRRQHGITRSDVDAIDAAYPGTLVIDRVEHQGPGRPAEVVRLAATIK